ncbi:MAG: TonB-dependent receptor [Rhodocyclaceae bacterium]|nr:MAG: TonB-dependent receptor [Rhodocyclaceae bacterium]
MIREVPGFPSSLEHHLRKFPMVAGWRLPARAVLLSVIAHVPVYAQEAPPGLGDGPGRPPGARIERIEVTARPQSDTDLRRKALVAKQVYSREEMDKYGDTNVADVLKRLPGVSMQGNAPRMRGLGAGYTLILLNGDPAPPGFALDQLSPSQVERIEVTKGPTADQSAQAVAGAINIIMKEPPRVTQRDLRLGAGYAAERPTVNGNFTLGERIGAFSASLPVSVFEWRNQNRFFNDRSMPGTDYLVSRAVQNGLQPYWGHGLNFGPRVNWKLSDEQTLALQSFIQKGYWNNQNLYTNQVLSGLPSFDDDAVTHGTWQTLRGSLQYTNRLSDSRRIELKAGIQDSRGTFDNRTFRDSHPQRRALGDNQDRGVTQAGKLAQLVGEDQTLTLGWNLEWRRRDEKREVSELGIPQLPDYEGLPFAARIARRALFVQDEWELSPQWSTYLGLRNERIVTESSGTATTVKNVSSVLTPLWHLNYKLDPNGKDMLRASLTRSYKAPELSALLSRPSVSALFTNTAAPNAELSPDRIGNPLLRPELATGLDLAFEKYLAGGGLLSVGVFHRRVSNLIRNVIALGSVDWAGVPRWVSRPVNFSKAQTTGLELEAKGRAGELLPTVFDPKLALNLRMALNFYRSAVEAVPAPNNRLDGQQPWSGTFGFDYRVADLPLTTGASLAFTPGYATQQTLSQALEVTRNRALDLFAQWTFSRSMSLRLSANNLAPFDTLSRTILGGGYGSVSGRSTRTQFGAALEFKL